LASSLLVMGISTLCIGLLPSYASWGIWAPITLCVLRFGQGLGLGGEWAGAALLATEHAPAGKRGWFGMFPQLGPSVGFLLATLSFLGLTLGLTEAQFNDWGWRLPFIASALLVAVGLYVRFKLAETPVFSKVLQEKQAHAFPIQAVIKQALKPILLGALAMGVCYNLFYTATVFCLSYGTQHLGIARPDFLSMLCVAVLFMTLATPLSAWLSDRYGRRPVLLMSASVAVVLGFALAPLLSAGSVLPVTTFLILALFLMGACFAPMGAFLPEQFAPAVRYTGAGLAYQLGGILGASFAPSASQWLVGQGGLTWVGYYVSGMALLSLIAVAFMQEEH
jgi:MFS family permease